MLHHADWGGHLILRSKSYQTEPLRATSISGQRSSRKYNDRSAKTRAWYFSTTLYTNTGACKARRKSSFPGLTLHSHSKMPKIYTMDLSLAPRVSMLIEPGIREGFVTTIASPYEEGGSGFNAGFPASVLLSSMKKRFCQGENRDGDSCQMGFMALDCEMRVFVVNSSLES